MNIELKNIKFSESMSEETNAFTADVYINGYKAAYAKNDGHGGSTFYHLHDQKYSELLKEAEEYCLGLPPIDFGSFKHKMDLESKIDELFETWLQEKEKKKFDTKLKKDMVKGLCVKIDGGYELLTWKGHTIDTILKLPKGKETILNRINKLKTEGRVILNTNLVGLV